MALKVVKEPKVYLIGRQKVDEMALAKFLADEGISNWALDMSYPGQALVETAGRVCYMSYGKGRKSNAEFISHIIDVAHGSVLEHAVFSFLITGVSRSLTHELIRHRHLSFSQLSQRYVDETDVAFIEPESIREDDSLHGTWVRSVQAAQTAYTILASQLEAKYHDIEDKTLRRKLARQTARSVLPNATETKIFVTGNARAFRHFIEVRGSKHADAEINRLARVLLEVLKIECPAIFGDYEIKDGNVVTKYSGI